MSLASSHEQCFTRVLTELVATRAHIIPPADMMNIVKPYLNQLTIDSRRLLVRLFLRKTGAWIRSTSLIGRYPELCSESDSATGTSQNNRDAERMEKAIDGLIDHGFALDGRGGLQDLHETLCLLNLDELRRFAAANGGGGASFGKPSFAGAVRNGVIITAATTITASGPMSTKEELIRRLVSGCQRQRTLTGQSLTDLLRDRAKAVLGRMVMLDPAVVCVFERLHVAFFCLTELPREPGQTTMQDLLLAGLFHLRCYPDYPLSTADHPVFRDYQHLIEYETALRAELTLERLLGDRQFAEVEELMHSILLPNWNHYCNCAGGNSSSHHQFLNIYEPGWVYTRSMGKATAALGRLKKYNLEAEILQSLLAQSANNFCPLSRGRWWARLVLLLERYIGDESAVERQQRSADVARMALQDDPWLQGGKQRCAIVIYIIQSVIGWRKSVQERLIRIEKKKNAVKRGDGGKKNKKQKISHSPGKLDNSGDHSGEDGEPAAAAAILFLTKDRVPTITIYGKFYNESHRRLTRTCLGDKMGSGVIGKRSVWTDENQSAQQTQRIAQEPATSVSPSKPAYLTVEEVALQYYRRQGWSGYHSETTVFTTIFTLLFWDIMFASYVPGVFQNRFQSAPLDLTTEFFYLQRQSLIDKRLAEITAGEHTDILTTTFKLYSEKRPLCVGVNWDYFSLEDLTDILECLGGARTAKICERFAKSYKQARSGFPDLILWNREKLKVKAVEVKGPGDQLMDHQKTWIDFLLDLPMAVELCLVKPYNHNHQQQQQKTMIMMTTNK